MEAWDTQDETQEETGEVAPLADDSSAETPVAEEVGSESEQGESVEPPADDSSLAGTSTEQAQGVGGTGDHPAPAAMRDETGRLRQHGEPLNSAGNSAPEGDSPDLPSGGYVTDEEARERLNAETEPEQAETDRPDLGTPSE